MERFLSQTAEYALRAVAWFGSQPAGARVGTQEISRETGIPAGYLAKILRRLVIAGVLESRKGQGGGFSLARTPGRISFEDVLRAVDAFPVKDRCAFGWGACDARHPCPLHDSWKRVGDQFGRWASTTTFAGLRHGVAVGRRRPRAQARSRR